MPDDVTVHNSAAGTGTSFDVATDDDGSGNHVQLIKLVQSANGSRTPIDADANGLKVSGTFTTSVSVVRKSVTPTISTGVYAAKDAIGALLTFSNAASGSGRPIMVSAAKIIDKDQERAEIDLVLFGASITAPTDNAVFDPTDAELADHVGTIQFNVIDYADFNDNCVAHRSQLGLDILPTGTDLYGVLVARSTPTYTATTDIVVELTIVQY